MEIKRAQKILEFLDDYNAVHIQSMQELLDFSDEFNLVIENSPNKPPYECSIIDLIGGVTEPVTSQIIKLIFQYKGENKNYPILSSFIERFIKKELHIIKPKIEAEKNHFDVSILDKQYAIIIENKLKGADFQLNQLARYIQKLKEKGYDENNIYIIVLPKFIGTKPRKSVGRLPKDWKKPNGQRKCAVSQYECWCDIKDYSFCQTKLKWCEKCDQTILHRLHDNTYYIHKDFANWLIDVSETLPKSENPLKSCMNQFAEYLKGLYQTRSSIILKMELQEYLQKRLLNGETADDNWQIVTQKLKEVDQLSEALKELRRHISIEYVKEWQKEIENEYEDIRHKLDENGIYSFGLNICGIWVGCWAGDNDDYQNQPYWGFWTEKLPTNKQIQMVKKILQACGKDTELNINEKEFMSWDNTLHGADRCREFYEAAINLGFIEE